MANSTWQLQTAKNKLSEVVELAITSGPQTITRRGKDAVVVISAPAFAELKKPALTFHEVMKKFKGLDFPDVPRDSDPEGRATPFRFDENDL